MCKNLINQAIIKTDHLAIYRAQVLCQNIPPKFPTTKILQLSDMHLGHRKKDKQLFGFLSQLPELLGNDRPDYIVMTGDFVDTHPDQLSDEFVSVVRRMFPGVPVMFVYGNHDYLFRTDEHWWQRTKRRQDPRLSIGRKFRQAGFIDLNNKCQRFEVRGHGINFIGIDDIYEGKPDCSVLQSANPIDTNILLTHSIDGFDQKKCSNVDLVLSGHLHGGEIDLGFISGREYLRLTRHFYNTNKQTKMWQSFGRRTMSHLSPGLATHNPTGRRVGAPAAGVSLVELVSGEI